MPRSKGDALKRRAAPARLVGAETEVPCIDGRTRRYVNLDYAASTPALAEVWEAVQAFLPWYSSVHRGSGFKSQLATAAFEGARESVRELVRARSDQDVVFVRNTTEAINVLSETLPPAARVLSSPVEHHSNMLPWRRRDLQMLPFTRSADELCAACEHAFGTARPGIDLLAVTGASNVTGEVWPIARLAALAHDHGAELFVDAAQLAPHRPVDMAGAGVDYLALSGHKMYAPFGAGALVGNHERLRGSEPLLRGGGAIKLVTLDDVIWADGPELHEAGSPNVVGVVALGAACRQLAALGMDAVVEHERELSARLWTGLSEVEGLQSLRLWRGADRVGLATFNLDGYRHPLLAAVLSAEHGIGVRNGCFCAHPLIARLLGLSSRELERLRVELGAGNHPPLPGAVRASLGLGTTREDVDYLVAALHAIAERGPRASYEHAPELDEYRPAADALFLPGRPFALDAAA